MPVLRLQGDVVVPADPPQEGAPQGRARAGDAGEGAAEHQGAHRGAAEGRRGGRHPHRRRRDDAAQRGQRPQRHGHKAAADTDAASSASRHAVRKKNTY